MLSYDGYLLPGLPAMGTPWHLAGLPEYLPWTGEVVDFDRPAGAIKVQIAAHKCGSLAEDTVSPGNRQQRP